MKETRTKAELLSESNRYKDLWTKVSEELGESQLWRRKLQGEKSAQGAQIVQLESALKCSRNALQFLVAIAMMKCGGIEFWRGIHSDAELLGYPPRQLDDELARAVEQIAAGAHARALALVNAAENAEAKEAQQIKQ